MKLEIVREASFADEDWFAIYLDGRYIIGSYNRQRIEEIFTDAVSDPENFFKTRKEVLKSEEISVNLQEKN
jgi:hypothetical protein